MPSKVTSDGLASNASAINLTSGLVESRRARCVPGKVLDAVGPRRRTAPAVGAEDRARCEDASLFAPGEMTPLVLFTIGHSTRLIEEFIRLLKAHGVHTAQADQIGRSLEALAITRPLRLSS